MTDLELIKALRRCGSRTANCDGCFLYKECGKANCIAPARPAADRLEALLANNTELRLEIQRLIFKQSELERDIGRLEVQNEHLTRTGKMASKDKNLSTGWRNGRWLPPEVGEYLVHIKSAKTATTLWYAGVREGEPVWRDLQGEEYGVTYWMPMPEVPKEGAEL